MVYDFHSRTSDGGTAHTDDGDGDDGDGDDDNDDDDDPMFMKMVTINSKSQQSPFPMVPRLGFPGCFESGESVVVGCAAG